MRVVVSSNCQTGGLGAALSGFLDGSVVEAIPYADAREGASRSQLLDRVREADVWVVSAPEPWLQGARAEVDRDDLRVVTVPDLYFDAFHPDLVYAWLPDHVTVDSAAGPYNSAIALWAWRHGLDAEATAELFTPRIFDRLGYTSRWTPAAERLMGDFQVHGLDGRDFLLPLQRTGVFMHSVNHPASGALVQMARMVAAGLGAAPQNLAEPMEDFVIDALKVASVVWPVYPGIADGLGFAGSLTWKLADQRIIRLDQYLRESFERYRDIDPWSFSCHQLEWPFYDEVLSEEIGVLLS